MKQNTQMTTEPDRVTQVWNQRDVRASKARILIVDDEPRMTASLGALLNNEGHQVVQAHSGEEAIARLTKESFDVVLADIRMPGINGLDVLRTARDLAHDRPVIMMTAYASLETARAAINDGAYDYLTKPIDLTELRLTVKRAIKSYRLHQTRDALLQQLHEKNKALSRRVTELNALHEVGAALSTTGELNMLLKAILNLATGVIGANYGSIMLLDPSRETLKVAAVCGALAGGRRIDELPVGDSIAGRVALTGEPLIIEDVENDPQIARRNRPQFETNSLICAPLKTPNSILGVINLSDKRDRSTFSHNDLRLLVTLAAQAAMAIKDSQNFRQVQRQLDEVTALHELSNRLTAVEHTDQMVDAVLSTLADLTRCECIQWWEWQSEPPGLVLTAEKSGGDPGHPPPTISISLSADAIVDEATCAKAVTDVLCRTGEHRRMRAVFTMSVKSAERPLGAFVLIREHQMPFSDYEQRLVRLVGSQAERIFERQRALLNASRLVTMGKMISEIAHDLRKPLTNIRGSLQVLNARLGDQPEHTTLLRDTEQEIVRLATLVSELVDFSNPKRYHTERHDLVPILKRAVELIERSARKHGITVAMELPERLPPIFCDQNQIIEALLNLLMNAIESMPDGGTLTVTADAGHATANNEKRLSITIRDTGSGMTTADLARIFERYHTTKPAGTGLGLPIVQRIITSHQGNIHAESNPGVGTTFRIELPIR